MASNVHKDEMFGVTHEQPLSYLGIILGKSSQDTEVCVKNLHCPQIWERSPGIYVFSKFPEVTNASVWGSHTEDQWPKGIDFQSSV